MIDLHLFLAFVAAAAVLMLIPGPNVALIVANSVTHGARYGLVTVAGTASAMVIQLGATGLGMTEFLHAFGVWFGVLRWIGVTYLLYLGIVQWRATPIDLGRVPAQPRSRAAMFWRAHLVSLTNPKTLFFYAAFFPQFVDHGRDLGARILLLSATFLIVAIVIDSGWALLAARARGLLATNGRLRNRVGGAALMGAALGLAASRNSA